MARPSKINEEFIKNFSDLVEVGNTPETVAQSLGITPRTYYNYIYLGPKSFYEYSWM